MDLGCGMPGTAFGTGNCAAASLISGMSDEIAESPTFCVIGCVLGAVAAGRFS